MLLVDVNLLVHAADEGSPDHAKARSWLEGVLADGVVAMPGVVLVGFVRVTTHPRISANPVTLDVALKAVRDWVQMPSVRVLAPGPQHWQYFEAACKSVNAKGNLVTDAHLAALAFEHSCEVASSDSDFAKFPGLRWHNPLAVPN